MIIRCADQPHARALLAEVPDRSQGEVQGARRTSISCGSSPVWLTEGGGGCASGAVLGSALSTTAIEPELMVLMPGPPSRGLAGMKPSAPANTPTMVCASR